MIDDGLVFRVRYQICVWFQAIANAFRVRPSVGYFIFISASVVLRPVHDYLPDSLEIRSIFLPKAIISNLDP